MSWWRYGKSKGRGSWLISSEVSVWLFLLLAVSALLAITVAVNIANIFAGE